MQNSAETATCLKNSLEKFFIYFFSGEIPLQLILHVAPLNVLKFLKYNINLLNKQHGWLG